MNRLYEQCTDAMKIAIVSRGDAASGGAGRVAEQLTRGLRGRGHEVSHFVKRRPRLDYAAEAVYVAGHLGDVVFRNLFGLESAGVRLLFERQLQQADIVQFNDVSVAYGAMTSLCVARRQPTVIRLADFSAATGGCLYPGDCERYQVGCGACPQVGRWPLSLPLDQTRFHFKMHHHMATRPNVVGVTPSHFVAERALTGAWREADLRVIPNAVDTHVFCPSKREAGRRRLQLGAQDFALLFVAVEVGSARKGFEDAWRAFEQLRATHPSMHLVVVGDPAGLPQIHGHDHVHWLGAINHDERLAEIYAAGDCLVSPTTQDNFPLTVLEVLACGTPAVVYPTGGLPEFVGGIPGGSITTTATPESLREHVQALIARPEATRQQTVAHVRGHYDVERLLDAYEGLYREHIVHCAQSAPIGRRSAP